jgi:hypothetical protein
MKGEEEDMKTVCMLIIMVAVTVSAWAGSIGDSVNVEIRSDNRGSLSIYPVSARYPAHKAYAEAVRGENYSIVVHNRLNRRVGVVVAVDGRNIISGKKSWLRNSERMYILEPYETGEYSGWRSGQDRINRFYFTSVADSYAAAFRDESAMGVIALAVYPEVQRYQPPVYKDDRMSRDGAAAPAAPAMESRAQAKKEKGRAGTGYGREEYAPSTVVAFEPESSPVEKIYVKYEWRSTLCRKGVIRCGSDRYHRQDNRMWQDDGYAPPPPGRE